MKGKIVVAPGLLVNGDIVFVVAGVAVGAVLLGIAGAFLMKRKSKSAATVGKDYKRTSGGSSFSSTWFSPMFASRKGSTDKKSTSSAVANPVAPKRAKPGAKETSTVTAIYAYKANETGELSFKKGDIITVIEKDSSGWWEGKTARGQGVFPANYVK